MRLPAGEQISRGAKGEARYPYRHHNLGRLFGCLEESVRAPLAEQYRRFRTLHPYIGPATVEKCLKDVSAEDGRGYERWRYSLTAPEKKIPTNSAEALISIWDTAVRLCETKRKGWRMRGVYEHLSEGLAWSLEEIMEKLNVKRMESGVAYHDFRQESVDWMRAQGGVLNAFSELAHRAHRGLLPDPGADGLSGPFAEALRRWVQARDGGAAKAQSDVRVFVGRAAGYRGRAQGVRWNVETKGFEDVPWDLRETTADLPPPEAFRFEDDFRGTDRLRQMKWLFQRGFLVNENYPAKEDMPGGKWLCTLCGEKAVASGGSVAVRFWEHPEDEDGFHVEVVGG